MRTFYLVWVRNSEKGSLELDCITQDWDDIGCAIQDNDVVVVEHLSEDSIAPPRFED